MMNLSNNKTSNPVSKDTKTKFELISYCTVTDELLRELVAYNNGDFVSDKNFDKVKLLSENWKNWEEHFDIVGVKTKTKQIAEQYKNPDYSKARYKVDKQSAYKLIIFDSKYDYLEHPYKTMVLVDKYGNEKTVPYRIHIKELVASALYDAGEITKNLNTCKIQQQLKKCGGIGTHCSKCKYYTERRYPEVFIYQLGDAEGKRLYSAQHGDNVEECIKAWYDSYSNGGEIEQTPTQEMREFDKEFNEDVKAFLDIYLDYRGVLAAEGKCVEETPWLSISLADLWLLCHRDIYRFMENIELNIQSIQDRLNNYDVETHHFDAMKEGSSIYETPYDDRRTDGGKGYVHVVKHPKNQKKHVTLEGCVERIKLFLSLSYYAAIELDTTHRVVEMAWCEEDGYTEYVLEGTENVCQKDYDDYGFCNHSLDSERDGGYWDVMSVDDMCPIFMHRAVEGNKYFVQSTPMTVAPNYDRVNTEGVYQIRFF